MVSLWTKVRIRIRINSFRSSDLGVMTPVPAICRIAAISTFTLSFMAGQPALVASPTQRCDDDRLALANFAYRAPGQTRTSRRMLIHDTRIGSKSSQPDSTASLYANVLFLLSKTMKRILFRHPLETHPVYRLDRQRTTIRRLLSACS